MRLRRDCRPDTARIRNLYPIIDAFNDSTPNDDTCEAVTIVFKKYGIPTTKMPHRLSVLTIKVGTTKN